MSDKNYCLPGCTRFRTASHYRKNKTEIRTHTLTCMDSHNNHCSRLLFIGLFSSPLCLFLLKSCSYVCTYTISAITGNLYSKYQTAMNIITVIIRYRVDSHKQPVFVILCNLDASFALFLAMPLLQHFHVSLSLSLSLGCPTSFSLECQVTGILSWHI